MRPAESDTACPYSADYSEVVVLVPCTHCRCGRQATMIMGADVTHKVAGISVAGVVGSADSSYAP